MEDSILCRTEQTDRINTLMLVETFIFRIDQHLPEDRIHLIVFNRGTVLIEILTNLFSVSAIDNGSLTCLWILDTREITR